MPRSSSLLGALLLIVAPSSPGCGSDTEPASQVPPCPAYEPILLADQATGLQRCTDGSITRPQALACPVQPSKSEAVCGADATSSCHKDADCTEQPAGYCRVPAGGEAAGCRCSYGCVRDSDCGDGQICRCGSPVGTCIAASCHTDYECPAGQRCTEYGNAQNPCSNRGFACTTPRDTCAGDSCLAVPDPSSAAICRPGADGAWGCVTESICVSGRPLVVEQAARRAPLWPGRGWG